MIFLNVNFKSFLVLVATFISFKSMGQSISDTVIEQKYWLEISGRVLDKKNHALDFATVVIIHNGILKGGAKTDKHGYFKIKPIEKGTYSMRYSYSGYITEEITNVKVDSNLIINEVRLEKKAGTKKYIYHGCSSLNPPLINRNDPNQKIIQRKEMKQMGFY